MRMSETRSEIKTGRDWKAQTLAVLLACHFLIILTGAFAAFPSSSLQQSLANKFLGYYQLFDLGQGYRFYAPRPAPTAIITAKLKIRDETGRVKYETVRIPHRNIRPRLRLQRELALANSLWGEYERSLALPDGQQPKPVLAKAFARHLGKSVPGCESVELFLHRNPNPQEVEGALRRGQVLTLKDLEDESFNTPTESLGAFSCE
jgi:hypothetical protein